MEEGEKKTTKQEAETLLCLQSAPPNILFNYF